MHVGIYIFPFVACQLFTWIERWESGDYTQMICCWILGFSGSKMAVKLSLVKLCFIDGRGQGPSIQGWRPTISDQRPRAEALRPRAKAKGRGPRPRVKGRGPRVEAEAEGRELESLRGHGGYLRVFHAFNPRTLLCRLLEISSAPIAYLTIFVKYLVLFGYMRYM